MDEKDIEEIMKNVIDGYLPGALEKNLPALPKADELREIRGQLTLAYGALVLLIIVSDGRDILTKGMRTLVERLEGLGVDMQMPKEMLDLLEMGSSED